MIMNDVVSDKIANFFKQYKKQVFKKGEILIRSDEEPRGIYYLTSGTVKEYAISKNGEELVVNIFKPISFFPMSFVFNPTPNNYYYEALEEIETWRASKDAVVEFLNQNPDVMFDLIGRVYKGMDGFITKLVYLMSGEAYERVITEILIAARRFGTITNNKIAKVTISEKDLANQTGMARETVSREIKKLKSKNLVIFDRKKLIITDISKLEEELSR